MTDRPGEDFKTVTSKEYLDLLAKVVRLREALDPLGTMFSGKGGSPEASWYEETIFNEARLYESLGKEDARTVLYIWDRYRKAVEALPDEDASVNDEG